MPESRNANVASRVGPQASIHVIPSYMDLRHVLFLASLLIPIESASGQASATWQQRVDYEMDVTLDANRHQIDGRQLLRYENNSPDTLRRVYYHLYFNAFHPQSMMAERNRRLPDPDSRIVPRIFNLGQDEIGYHRIVSLSQNGVPVSFHITDTVMEVELADPIPPGDTAEFAMSFQSQVPLQTRRSGRDNREGIDYSMTQWYPKLAEYDERGWHADPYVGREFYAPFGTFDVRITLPSEYTIGATGVLQNPDEVGHGYAADSIEVAADSLTWHFRAEDVHDFAWAADPDYIHDVLETENGTTVHLLYQPDVSDNWQNLHDWGPEIMEFFSAEYGTYPYPQVTIVQGGDGGMEYPMITLITGRRSPASLRGVTAHELAHMWYYGVLASNEADYAWMDEGFTTYVSTEVNAHLQDKVDPSHAGSYLTVLQAQHYGLFERLNTPSDWFHTNYGYGVASYSGGAMLVEMLGYVISDSLRDRFLDEYFERFQYRHPNPYDLEKIAEDVSGLRLDWYFDQFANSTRTLDYAVKDLRSTPSETAWRTEVLLERESDAVVPVDLRLTMSDGTQQWVTVPLGIMQGHKPVPEEWAVAEPWLWTSPTYVLTLDTPERVVQVEIDPLQKTPDANRLNNRTRLPLNFSFLRAPSQSWSQYNIGWRPLAQYAHNWGFGAGLQFRGRYLFNRFRTQVTVKLWPEVLFSDGTDPDLNFFTSRPGDFSMLDGIDFDISFSDKVATTPYMTLSLDSRKHLGILENEASVSILLDSEDILTSRDRQVKLGVRHQHRTSRRAEFNHVSSGFFPESMVSGWIELSLRNSDTRVVAVAETGGKLEGEGPALTANRAYLDAAQAFPIGPFTGTLRGFIGIGGDDLALHKRYRLGTVTYEDRWRNDAYRTIGAALENPLLDAHWIAFGLPGPVSRARFDTSPSFGRFGEWRGTHMVAGTARLLTPRPPAGSILNALRLEAFASAGDVWSSGAFLHGFRPANLEFDAGIGLEYDVSRLTLLRRWTAQSDVLTGLKLRARFPLWATDPGRIGSAEGFAFRWLLGIDVNELPWN